MQQHLNRPKLYQFRIGDCVITNVLEGYFHRDDLHPFVATNATASEVEALAAEYKLPFPALEHNFVSSIIKTSDKLIAIDPGFGPIAPAPTTGWFMQGLQVAGYSANDVDIVLISHCHPDHIGNISENGTPIFPNAEIVIGRQEFDFWKQGEGVSEMRQPTLGLFQKAILPLEDQLKMIEPGDEIVSGLLALDAFGHSAGHLVFELSTAGKKLMFLNDATPHYVASFANPDWHFSMDDDPIKAAVSRRNMLDLAASGNVPVIGFHLPFPSVGYVEKRGDGYEFRPATYQFNLPST
ncbi:MAG: MBL fold metallo-hydrolase [Rhodobacteraceae bacterium]|nr:MBL fold metallo-hydrolase [Paracoccaceae bacterium]